MSAAHASYDALYGPSSEELRRSVPGSAITCSALWTSATRARVLKP